jgi:CheY-like chemotaxis protein
MSSDDLKGKSIGDGLVSADCHPEEPARSKAALRKPSWENKLVLLVDTNSRTRDSRAKIMRTLGVTVHSVASAGAARARLASARYNLVLVDLGQDVAGAELLVQEVKTRNPRQRVAFLVGQPLYVASSLSHGTGPQRPSRPAARKTKGSAVTAADFGQKIRDAEAAQAAS